MRRCCRYGAVRIVAGFFLALKILVLFAAGVFVDEAYYWLWGQHPALSYYDHPPLNAWLQGISSLVFGWNVVGLRAMVLLSLLGDIFVIWLFAQRLPTAERQGYFWVTLVVFLVTPIFFASTAFALPDHLLLACCLASLYGFTRFFRQRPNRRLSLSLALFRCAVPRIGRPLQVQRRAARSGRRRLW